MKISVANIVIFAGGLLAGVGLFVYLVMKTGPAQVWASLLSFGVWPFVAFFVMSLINFMLYSWRWQILTNVLLGGKHRVPFWNVYLHRMSGYAVSYLTPIAQVGGEPARIALLTTDNVPTKTAVSSVTLDIAFELAAYVLFILAGVVFALFEGTMSGTQVWYVGGALMLAFGIFVGFLVALASGKKVFVRTFRALRLHNIRRLQRAEHWLEEMEETMSGVFHGRRTLVVFICLLSLAMIGFRVVEMFFIALFFGVSLNFSQVFLISTLPGIALLLPVPAGLGVFEGTFAMVFSSVGVAMDPVAFALVIRLRDLGFVAIGTLHMVRKGGHYFAQRMQKATKAMQNQGM